jgi:hypothetical protein
VGVSLGALVLAVAVLIFGFGGAILNGYGKGSACGAEFWISSAAD